MSVRPFHHQRPLTALALCYGLGIGAGVFLPCWAPAAAIGLLLGLILLWLLPRAGRRRTAAVLCCALFAGMGYAGIRAHPTLPPLGAYDQIEGVAAQDVALRENGRAYGYLEQVRLQGESGETVLGRVYWTFVPDADTPCPGRASGCAFPGSCMRPRAR